MSPVCADILPPHMKYDLRYPARPRSRTAFKRRASARPMCLPSGRRSDTNNTRNSDESDRQQQAAAPAVLRTSWNRQDLDHPRVREEAVWRRIQDDGLGGKCWNHRPVKQRISCALYVGAECPELSLVVSVSLLAARTFTCAVCFGRI